MTPIILAPLAGGPCTPALVAAAANAGAFAFFGGAYLSPRRLAESLQQVRALTSHSVPPAGVIERCHSAGVQV